jgi:Fic family protein
MIIGGVIMTYIFEEMHYHKNDGGSIQFQPNLNVYDHEILQGIFEAERNIGALARLGLKNHPLKPTILRNSMVRTAHFTTKIEQNKLELNEVEELYRAYKKTNQLTVKEKSRIEVRNVFDAYSYIWSLEPDKDFNDMNEHVLVQIQETLMKDLTAYPSGYRQIPVNLKDGDGEVSYTPPSFTEVGSCMSAFFKWLYTSVTGKEHAYSEEIDPNKHIHPLLLSAISHFVIGYIHPFPDGNGRSARAFSTLVGLIHGDSCQIKDAFCVEEYFDKYIEDYYDTLMLGDQGDLKPFVLFYLRCVNLSLIKVLKELQRHDRIKHLRELFGQNQARQMLEMVALMKDGDEFSRELFDKALNASKPSVTVNIRKLKENGVIKPTDQRGRYIVCIAE